MILNKKIEEFLRLNLYNSCLESFGIKKQFIELELSNSRFEEIKFFIDCKINTLDLESEKIISILKDLDKDTFEIIYFLKANLKHIVDCSFDSDDNFRVNFENNYVIIFNLNCSDDANLSITFREKENSDTYTAIEIQGDGILTMN